MKPLLGVFFLTVGFALAKPALASDLVTSRTVLEDPSAAMTIADVVRIEGRPVGSDFSMGTTDSVHWVRLRIQPPAHGSKVVIFIRPTYLNEIRLYEAGPGDPRTWKTRVTGNHYPYSQRDRKSIALGFVVDVAPPGGTFYLRLKTRSPSSLNVVALEPDEADRKDHQRDLVIVFFVTAMLCLLFWAVHSYLVDRQPVVGLFALHQAVYTLFGVVATGYLGPVIPESLPQFGDWINMVLYCAIGFTPVLFSRALFKPYEPPPVLMRGLTLALWVFPFQMAAIALYHYTLAVIVSAVFIKITWLYFVAVAFSLRKDSVPGRHIVQAFYVFILANNLVFWYANRTPWIATTINLSAVQLLVVDGLVIGGLFAMMLHTRARQVYLEAQRSAMDLLLVQRKFELEQELKKQAEIQAQTDYLTGLFNRRRFVEAAEHELERAIRFQRPLTLLMVDIDHFKAINDTWGHGFGDVVLQNVSQLMRDALREADIFGRTGGEEFAAVIVETEGEDAIQTAQRLCSVVADAKIVPPGAGQVKVTVSVGLSQLNGRNISFEELLHEADRAMYRAKEAGRNGLVISR